MVDGRGEAPPGAVVVVVVVGASAGGVEALARLGGGLDVFGPARIGAAVEQGVERVCTSSGEEPRARYQRRREEADQAAASIREALLGRDAGSA